MLTINPDTQQQKPRIPAGEAIVNDTSTDTPKATKTPATRYMLGNNTQPKMQANTGFSVNLEISFIIVSDT